MCCVRAATPIETATMRGDEDEEEEEEEGEEEEEEEGEEAATTTAAKTAATATGPECSSECWGIAR